MLYLDKVKGVVEMPQHEDPTRCESLGGACPLYDMSALMGASVFDAFMTFLWSAESGARLTLQRNKDEFTLQVTGAVQRSDGATISLEQLQDILAKLNPNGVQR